MSVSERVEDTTAWHTLPAADVASRLSVDPDQGLEPTRSSGGSRSTDPTSCPRSRPRACGTVARGQLSNPMNIMLLIVAVASFVDRAGGRPASSSLGLVTFNVVMGSNQELKARASVEALAQLQVPHARVRRSGRLEEVESTEPRAGRRRPARGR